VAAIARILCAVDLSDASAHALEHATAIARWAGAALTVLNVKQTILMPVPALPAPVEPLSNLRRPALLDCLTTFVQSASAAGVSTTALVDVGEPVSKILEHAGSLPADLLVIGTHGASGFERLVLGSVAEKILRKATCPVLTVPPRAHTAPFVPFQRILCAIDFSDWSSEALALAGSLARESKAAIEAVHVIEWPWDEPPPPDLRQLRPAEALALVEFRRYLEASATKRLETLVRTKVSGECVAESRIRHGKAYVEILRAAVERRADLIVIGVHSRGRVDMGVFGSTANHVVRGAACPVLTVKAQTRLPPQA